MDVSAAKRALPSFELPALGVYDSGELRAAKSAKRVDTQAASQRHIKTEQARRDKISAGFQALQGLLPGREKVEKAMLLTQAAEYIAQLQGVLQMLMASGAISKLPDELQFQIRMLLPRKDGKPIGSAPQPQQQQSELGALPPTVPQQPIQPPPATSVVPPGVQLPFMPMIAPAALQMPEMNKELSQDESSLMNQIQTLLQQQQQQAAAAQQLQTWQQTIQALQLQQVLQQQQQGQCMVDMGSAGGFATASNPLTSLAYMPSGQPPSVSMTMPSAVDDSKLNATHGRRPGDCFADELPKCGLQQLMDAAACEPNAANNKQMTSPPHKARKNAVKVRRHTTAARIPKPDSPHPTRVGAGRPEPV